MNGLWWSFQITCFGLLKPSITSKYNISPLHVSNLTTNTSACISLLLFKTYLRKWASLLTGSQVEQQQATVGDVRAELEQLWKDIKGTTFTCPTCEKICIECKNLFYWSVCQVSIDFYAHLSLFFTSVSKCAHSGCEEKFGNNITSCCGWPEKKSSVVG